MPKPFKPVECRSPGGALQLRAVPNSYDEAEHSIVVSIGTGAEGLRWSWSEYEYYIEELDVAGCNFERVDRGVCGLFLDHTALVEKQIGRVDALSASVVGGEIQMKVLLSRQERWKDLIADIKADIIRAISVRYTQDEIEEIKSDPKKGELTRKIVRKWTPLEVSFVGIPFDSGASARNNDGGEPPTIEGRPGPERAAMSAENHGPGTTTQPVITPELEAQIQKAERARCAQLRALGKRIGVPDDDIEAVLADDTARTYEAGAAKLAELRAKATEADPPPTPPSMRSSYGASVNDHLAVGLTQALEMRFGLRHVPGDQQIKLVGAHVSLENICRRFLDVHGEQHMQLTASGVLERNLQLSSKSFEGILRRRTAEEKTQMRAAGVAPHTPTDFASAMGYVGMKYAEERYEAEPLVFDEFARQRPLSTLNATKMVRLGTVPGLTKIPDGGEVQYGKLIDAGETYQASHFGAAIALDESIILKDDIGAVQEWYEEFGSACTGLQKDQVFGLFTANDGEGATLSQDSVNWFNAAHNNVSGDAGTPSSVDRIGAVRDLVEAQLAYGSTTRFRFNEMIGLLVPTHYRTAAEKVLDLNYNGSTGAAPTSMQRLRVWADPRLGRTGDGNKPWFGVGARSGLVFGFFAGINGPRIRMVPNPKTLGIDIIADMYFACGVQTPNGIVQNPYGLS